MAIDMARRPRGTWRRGTVLPTHFLGFAPQKSTYLAVDKL
jgi:hypothetical protein